MTQSLWGGLFLCLGVECQTYSLKIIRGWRQKCWIDCWYRKALTSISSPLLYFFLAVWLPCGSLTVHYSLTYKMSINLSQPWRTSWLIFYLKAYFDILQSWNFEGKTHSCYKKTSHYKILLYIFSIIIHNISVIFIRVFLIEVKSISFFISNSFSFLVS